MCLENGNTGTIFHIVLPDRDLIFGHGHYLYDQFPPIDLPLPNITLDLASDFTHQYAGQVNYAEGLRPLLPQRTILTTSLNPTLFRCTVRFSK